MAMRVDATALIVLSVPFVGGLATAWAGNIAGRLIITGRPRPPQISPEANELRGAAAAPALESAQILPANDPGRAVETHGQPDRRQHDLRLELAAPLLEVPASRFTEVTLSMLPEGPEQ